MKADESCRAYLWLRGSKQGFGSSAEVLYRGTEDHPITAADWQTVELEGALPPEAKTLDFGLALVGKGTAWIDGVSLEPEKSPTGASPDRSGR